MPKIWVADDDEAIRIVLEEGLNRDGLEIKTFSDGHTPPDIILNS